MDAFLNSASLESEIELVEPNYIYTLNLPKVDSLQSSMIQSNENISSPNDPRFGELWGLHNTGTNIPGSSSGNIGADIKALKAWELTKGSRKIKIAVIDTGVDYSHSDLKDNIWTNPGEIPGNGIDDDGNGYIDDVHGYDFANNDGDPMDGHGHGTHCSGTIGAVHDNGIGVAGVMGEVSIVGVKFLTDSGSGTSENAIKSIDYATQLGVDIMSNSWGGGGYSQALEEVIQEASKKGILFVAAAGNSGTDNDKKPHYPSNYQIDNVISVAASTGDDDLASFSCFGKKTVHIAAPGHKILSTVAGNDYKVFSGTSMATPHVSGALGLLLAYEENLTVEEVKRRLLLTSDPVASFRGKNQNSGRLNAFNLLTDTRPFRNTPSEGAWVRLPLGFIWETEHPYLINQDDQKLVKFEGARFIRPIISKYETEDRYDFLEILDKEGKSVQRISGTGENYTADYVEGDTMTLKFHSDRSIVKWGFLLEEVEVQY